MNSKEIQCYELSDVKIFLDENNSIAWYEKEKEFYNINIYYFDYDTDYKIFHCEDLFVVFINTKSFYFPKNHAIEWKNGELYPFYGEEYNHLAFKIKNNQMKLYVYCVSFKTNESKWINRNKLEVLKN